MFLFQRVRGTSEWQFMCHISKVAECLSVAGMEYCFFWIHSEG